MTVLRKGRVIRHVAVQTQAAEPAVSQVEGKRPVWGALRDGRSASHRCGTVDSTGAALMATRIIDVSEQGKRVRRPWSDEDKARFVTETLALKC